MATNLLDCMVNLASVDPSKEADLMKLNLETVWKSSVLAMPIHTPFLARWISSKPDMIKEHKTHSKPDW